VGDVSDRAPSSTGRVGSADLQEARNLFCTRLSVEHVSNRFQICNTAHDSPTCHGPDTETAPEE
jgi:hypothetical protein